jgi:phospholipid/cholesterol/gamma-HCH transport system substrate-binding protein
MSELKAGVIGAVLIALFGWFGFTKANPFADPYELQALMRTANGLAPRAPVRIAGVEVGKVKKVEALGSDSGAGARVTMEIEKRGLPIHEDASLKVRPRIFLEGNMFVDLEPGTASSPVLEDGARPIPMTRTAAPVQVGQVLAELQADTRADLRSLLHEYSGALRGSGARGFNRSIRHWEDAYRGAALANDAALGLEPTRDLRRLLNGQRRTFAALARDEQALKGLITSFNTTAAAFARESGALAASVPALRDTLRVGHPALASLNAALPSLRLFAREALPGVRSSGPTLDALVPFMRQLRALVGPRELRGAARELRRRVPGLTRLTLRLVPQLARLRSLGACTNEVLAPFFQSRIPDPDFPANSNQKVIEQMQRSFVGLAGESRLFDANPPYYRIQVVSRHGLNRVRPGVPPDGGFAPPPHRPDVPCETQEPPDLNAPGGPYVQFANPGARRRGNRLSEAELRKLFEAEKSRLGRLWRRQRVLDRTSGGLIP